MDEENFDNLFNFVLDNAVNKLGPSLHTRKQRRWRDKKKDKFYCTQISLPRLLIKQIKESNQYLSKINENFEDDVAANNPVFNDNILVHDILMDDTNTDGADASGTLDDDTHTIGTFDDDTLVDNYILDDDDYIYKFI
ncbi:unnamed protein product [Rotaria sp. Silwood1]|nr:unnamed protein product [Rotaria sp. Silwood1]CAF5128694.1 unnamed protein product [Rotaria sp. Silwood1]